MQQKSLVKQLWRHSSHKNTKKAIAQPTRKITGAKGIERIVKKNLNTQCIGISNPKLTALNSWHRTPPKNQ